MEAKLYRIGYVAKLLNKSTHTIRLWDKWSNQLEEQGRPRLIPKPHLVAHGDTTERKYDDQQIEQIRQFSKNLKPGDLVEFTNKRNENKKRRKVEAARKYRREQ